MLKGKVLQQEWPCSETSLQVVPPDCTHTSEETHALQQTHTPQEMYPESEDEETRTVK